ncbi:MAG: hypothetical protein J7497_09540 [Chitinophagaceae bacterium]|nr:hypothetical protein [Chitinophagaceae bacterium]
MAERTPIQPGPKLSKRAFWDTDLAALDFNRHAQFIIIRVFERGSEEDQMAILAFYGERAVSDVLKNAPSLLPIAEKGLKEVSVFPMKTLPATEAHNGRATYRDIRALVRKALMDRDLWKDPIESIKETSKEIINEANELQDALEEF